MVIKLLITALILFVVINMVFALRVMLKGGDKPMSHYLGRRLILSVIAIAIVLLALATGLIQPNPRPY
ncbi:DUF2909 domain-containing protein [Agarivorans sp. MS3-6]|uniref:DUF2909 domain-containing protein n=1 Tax=Agarivorans sp. TSD2052 TaxID=2937286 RepID=UPI00200E1EFB|nr:DUF2909 domain-containing protein [Agarivorans sp. TSD2052]UPW18853.1 DUF2909 domain-containing protein [Agarivorans sp. TSD2052]